MTYQQFFKSLFKNKLAFLFLLSSFALVSCGDDDDDEPDMTGNGTVTATIDGQSFSGSLATQAIYSNNVLVFAASGSTSPTDIRDIRVTIADVDGEGTYGTNTNGTIAIWAEGVDPNTDIYTANFLIGSGTFTITEFSDNRAKGTFEFTGANSSGQTKTVSNGEFDVAL